jgi:hypothetical protein
MDFSGRTLRSAAAVIYGLALFWVLTSIYPIAGFDTHSATEPIIPVLETDIEEPTAGLSGDDAPTPILLPTPAESRRSNSTETSTDPRTSEAVEAALREPFAQERNRPEEAARRDDHRGALANPAGNPADPMPPETETPSPKSPASENAIAFYQDAADTSPDQYTDVTAQPDSPQASTPDPVTGTETSPQAWPDLPMDAETAAEPPWDPPADAGTAPLPPLSPDSTTSSDLPADPSPLTGDTADLE